MDDLVSVATGPDRRSFAIFIAPPGSALDVDELGRGFGLGWVLSFVVDVALGARRALSRRWRVVVHERCDDSLGPVLARSSHGSEDEARRRVADLHAAIERGDATL